MIYDVMDVLFGIVPFVSEGVEPVLPQQVLQDDDEVVEDWDTEWVNDNTGASQQVEWFVEDWADDKDSPGKVRHAALRSFAVHRVEIFDTAAMLPLCQCTYCEDTK